jgi:hypothetical protein
MFLADNQPRKLNETPDTYPNLLVYDTRWVGYSANVTLSQLECRSMTVPLAEIIRLRSMSEDSIILHNHTSQERGAPDERGSFAESCSGRVVVCSRPGRADIPTPPPEESGINHGITEGYRFVGVGPGYQSCKKSLLQQDLSSQPGHGCPKGEQECLTADTMGLGVRSNSQSPK